MSHAQASRNPSAEMTSGNASDSSATVVNETQVSQSNSRSSRSRRASRNRPEDISLIHLNPLITDSTASLHRTSSNIHVASSSINDESHIDPMEKCWICFSSRSDELAGEASSNGIWKSPCKCALVAHEGCLLDWIADMEKGTASNQPIRCPQCKTEIKLRQEPSFAVELGRYIESAAEKATSLAVLAGVGSMVFISCTVYGVNTVYLVCGTRRANEILLANNGRDFEWTWRLGVGLPLIPLILIASRTRNMDPTLPVLPFIFFCHSDPLHFTFPPSPAIILSVLPYFRAVYNKLYDSLLLPYDRMWSEEAERNNGDSADHSTDDSEGSATRLPNGVGSGSGNNRAEQRRPGSGIAAGGREDPQNQEFGAELVLEEGNVLLGRNGAGNWIIGALLFPSVMAGMGGLLGRIPGLKKILPEGFHRNILGGCLFVLLKDALTLYYKYKRARQVKTRTIVNYRRSAVGSSSKPKGTAS